MQTHGKAVVIVLAAGEGRRLGAQLPKALIPIGGRPMLAMAAAAAAASPLVDAVVVAAPPGAAAAAAACVEGLEVPCTVVEGGASRQSSVRLALAAVGDGVDVIAVHDAARPFAPPDLFTTVIEAVRGGANGAVPVIAVTDTVKRISGDRVAATVDRDGLAIAQTPQAFRHDVLASAHDEAARVGLDVTDDALLLEANDEVVAVAGDPRNVKITTMFDLAEAEARMGADG